ncbi:MAG: hypothetical protein WC069_06305 [Candidatus Shapirobacteria bacterium]
MKTTILALFILAFVIKTYAQSSTFFVVGDNVNVRLDTSFLMQHTFQVDCGTKFSGKKESANWYSYFDELMDETRYISAKYVVNEIDFVNTVEQKNNKNGLTKYELLLHYKKDRQLNIALEYLIDIINHNSRDFYQKYEYCNLLGPMSYQHITSDNKGNVKYDSSLLKITDAVINSSQDSLLKSLAYIDIAKYFLRTGNLITTREILLLLIFEYSENLIIPIPCDYDFDGKIYPIISLKNLFFTMYHTMDRSEQISVMEKLREENRNPHNQKTKEILMDIYRNVNGSFWEPYKN